MSGTSFSGDSTGNTPGDVSRIDWPHYASTGEVVFDNADGTKLAVNWLRDHLDDKRSCESKKDGCEKTTHSCFEKTPWKDDMPQEHSVTYEACCPKVCAGQNACS